MFGLAFAIFPNLVAMANQLVLTLINIIITQPFSSVVRNNNILWTDVRETFYRKTDTSTFLLLRKMHPP